MSLQEHVIVCKVQSLTDSILLKHERNSGGQQRTPRRIIYKRFSWIIFRERVFDPGSGLGGKPQKQNHRPSAASQTPTSSIVAFARLCFPTIGPPFRVSIYGIVLWCCFHVFACDSILYWFTLCTKCARDNHVETASTSFPAKTVQLENGLGFDVSAGY